MASVEPNLSTPQFTTMQFTALATALAVLATISSSVVANPVVAPVAIGGRRVVADPNKAQGENHTTRAGGMV